MVTDFGFDHQRPLSDARMPGNENLSPKAPTFGTRQNAIWRILMHSQRLLQEIEILPPELQKQVSDFVVFLRKQQQKQIIKKRTVGEYKDKIVIHEDFDEPLGDEFWLGEK